jgi:hypothetical protein
MNERARTEDLTPDEKFSAVNNLKNKLEQNFIELGQLLSDLKRSKIYRLKGYETFNSFVESEFSLGRSMASKLVQVFDIFIQDMDQDEATIKEIGLDRLAMILPFVRKADWAERDEWLKKAASMPIGDLQESVKHHRKELRDASPDLKKVLVDQWKERMCNYFNCTWSEAQFKLALWFSSGVRAEAEVMTALKQEVREAQIRFEEAIHEG